MVFDFTGDESAGLGVQSAQCDYEKSDNKVYSSHIYPLTKQDQIEEMLSYCRPNGLVLTVGDRLLYKVYAQAAVDTRQALAPAVGPSDRGTGKEHAGFEFLGAGPHSAAGGMTNLLFLARYCKSYYQWRRPFRHVDRNPWRRERLSRLIADSQMGAQNA